jgi:pimeloyl-ACP methyl ester carboxylesterase
MRDSYAAFARNRTAWAQHWRHADGPRPTLCVIHGFGASPYWFNSAFFALPWFYGQGYDVLQYVLPFHGLRQHPLAPVRGSDYFSHGIAHMNEAVIQAIHDFRVFLDHLFASGVPRVAVTGLSLGGYMSALLAAVEERLHIVIPNAPVTDVAALVRTWFPANLMIAAVARLYGLSVEELEQAVALHCPLRYPPLVPRERLMIIGGLGDRLAPPEQSRALWTHWGEPRLHWYAGNHAVHVSRGDYLREMRRFFVAGGFVV